MIKIVAILQIMSVLFSVSGVNVFSHVCHETGTTSVSILQNQDNCSDHDCCGHNHNATHTALHTESCCDETANIACSAESNIDFDLKPVKCCEDDSEYLALTSIVTFQERVQTINIADLSTIDFDIPKFAPNIISSYFNLFDQIDYRRSFLASLIEYIHNTSDIADIS